MLKKAKIDADNFYLIFFVLNTEYKVQSTQLSYTQSRALQTPLLQSRLFLHCMQRPAWSLQFTFLRPFRNS